MIRLFINPPHRLHLDAQIDLSDDQAHYLRSVMRKSLGDDLLVFNGQEGEWRALIQSIDKRRVSIKLMEQTRTQPTSRGPVLLQALVKRSALDLIVEKATELGVARIQLLITDHTNASHTNLERLKAIAQEASEQCERLDVPEIHEPQKLSTYLLKGGHKPLIFADETTARDINHAKSMIDKLMAQAPYADPAILIGPEGGFSASEREAIAAVPHCLGVNLGPTILRADTAAIVAIGIFQSVDQTLRMH